MYAEKHGNLDIDPLFVVPSKAPWAQETWGLPLGRAVNHLRRKGINVRGRAGLRAVTALVSNPLMMD